MTLIWLKLRLYALDYGWLAWGVDLSPLIVESYSLRVIQFVLDRLSARTELFWRISEVKNLLSLKHSFQARHISRVCNTTADALAKYYVNCRDLYAWVKDFPPHLCCYIWDLLSC